MQNENETRAIKTFCGMCSITCPIEVHLKGGEVDKIRIPEGHYLKALCVKNRGGLKEFQYSKDRIVNPLKKVPGGWRHVSWDYAFSGIADKLHNIKEKYGPESLVVYVGNAHVLQQVENIAHRFCDVYGTPNYSSVASYCHFGRVIGNGLTFGCSKSYGIFAYPMYRKTKCMILWGTNPDDSAQPIAGVIPLMKKRGAKLIVIDPRKTKAAKQADIHVQLRPGTDCALALGMMHVIISEKLYDHSFVQNYTTGFQQLAEHVKFYTPAKVEEITWVPAEIIRTIAREYATNKPALIAQGLSLDHHTNGIQTSRSTAILIAITGNINILGGNFYYPSLPGDTLRVPKMVTARSFSDYPIFEKIVQETQNAPFADAVLSEKPYPIKALIVQGGNPILTSPNSSKLRKAFEKLELLVVIDHFMTDTAVLADIVLPPTTFLEGSDIIKIQGRPMVSVRIKALDPPENCKESTMIWVDLAKRMGYADYFPWESVDEVIESILKPTGITLEQVRGTGIGYQFDTDCIGKYLKEDFDTPSGKVELYSKTLEDHGYPPLPIYEEPAESPVSRPDLLKKYPLILTTGSHIRYFTHSRYRNISSLIKHMQEPFVQINTKNALEKGISDGDKVVLESLRGEIELRASVTEDILPGVISLSHGWSSANANYLTDDEKRDPISGYPGFRSLLCNVRKA